MEQLGYDIHESTVTTAEEVVSRYAKVDIEYPCFTIVKPIDEESNKKLTLHVTKILPSMFKCSSKDKEDAEYIAVYFKDGARKFKLGRIMSRQVKPILRLFEGFDIEGYLSKEKELVGDYLYVLSE